MALNTINQPINSPELEPHQQVQFSVILKPPLYVVGGCLL